MRRAWLGLFALCVHCAREVPAPVTPDMPLASATPIAAKPTPPPPCHGTAFRTPATQIDIDAGLAKLDELEKRAALTFDADASKPALTGNDVFVRTDPKTNTASAGTLEPLVAEATTLDDALRAVRPTAIIAARSLARVGLVYDALTVALEAWSPTLLTPAQSIRLQQLQSSGRTQLVQLALQANASATKALEDRRNSEADVMRSNAYTAYLGALQLLFMTPSSAEVAELRARVEARVHALFPIVDPRKSTRPRQDPTSESAGCNLDVLKTTP